MLDEKGNEKRNFIKGVLIGALSIGALYVASKIPSVEKKQLDSQGQSLREGTQSDTIKQCYEKTHLSLENTIIYITEG